jgi:hypothetical protein
MPVTSRDRSTAGLSASAAGDDVLLPQRQAGPVRTMTRRLLLALATVAVMTSTVLLDRNGYTDNRDGHVSVLDAAYYSGVSLSTTGYGDIVPMSRSARLVNLVVIMPLRVFFLALLVGTTFEVLTQRTRRQWRLNHHRGGPGGRERATAAPPPSSRPRRPQAGCWGWRHEAPPPVT